MEKRKTIEEYERLAHDLAEQRDAKSEVAARLATENKALRAELKPMLERLSGLLGGTDEPTLLSYWALDGAIRLLMQGRPLTYISNAMFESLGVPTPTVFGELYAEYWKMKLTIQESDARATKRAKTKRPAKKRSR